MRKLNSTLRDFIEVLRGLINVALEFHPHRPVTSARYDCQLYTHNTGGYVVIVGWPEGSSSDHMVAGNNTWFCNIRIDAVWHLVYN